MDARNRQKRIRVADLVNTHPTYADAIGVKPSIKKNMEIDGLLPIDSETLAFCKRRSDMHYYLGLTTNNPNHNHEVHKETCLELPSSNNREYLGAFSISHGALEEAKRRHPTWRDIDGCKNCCPEIHTA